MEGDREGPQADGSETVSDKAASQARKRERSQIEFPYTDIGQASELVHALYHKGGGSAEREQLAAWMNQSASGGTFRSRVSAAAMFGFIRGQRGNIDITELGREVVDDASRPAALVEAFLRVPLFHALFDKFNGYPLPPQLPDSNIEGTRKMPAYKNSMALDYLNGRPMEIQAILGNVVALAEQHGVSTPRLTTMQVALAMRDRLAAASDEGPS